MKSIKILCLHGMGVNAEIFALQTAPFRRLLPSDYEFTFLEGRFECEPAPGVSGIFTGPYSCWYDTPTTSKVAKAHEYVLEVIREKGPFHGVMGFSQGGALAASILLHHKLAGIPPPFEFAVFICSPIPFSHSLSAGIDTRAYFGSPSRAPVRPGCPDEVPQYLITDPVYLRGEERLAELKMKMKKQQVLASLNDGFSKPSREAFYQMFHPTVDLIRIDIPTVHVIGRRDKWRSHSLDLVALCAAGSCTLFEHHGEHEIPKEIGEDMCDLIEAIVALTH
ncbi:serine hydrolase FSH [Phyllosticta citricarpa]|uniref:Serine hydrolase FSH n=2 Tax=Phyllosticta TaxID=121621 RepID=A0ABR1LIQ2_9PEZI